jgi:hypothetical protein
MDFKLDQARIEQAIIDQAVDRIYGDEDAIYERVRCETENRVNKIITERLNAVIDQTINSVMEKALDTEVQPVNLWGEREGKPTSIRAALHERAKDFWHEKVNDKGEKSTYGGKARYEHVLTAITAKEFDAQIKQNIVAIAGALKDAVRADFYTAVDAKLNEFFKITSLEDQKRAAPKSPLPF